MYKISSILNLRDDALVANKHYWETLSKIQPIVDDNQQYLLYALDIFHGLFISDFSKVYLANEGEFIQEDQITRQIISNQQQIQSVDISANQQQLFIGVRTIGIQIFDISDRFHPFLIQNIQVIGQGDQIRLSPNENQLFYCNGLELKIYNQIQPELSMDIPNVFNNLLSKITNIEYKYLDKVPWRVKVSPDQKYIYVAGAKNGGMIFDIQNDPLNPQILSYVEPDAFTNPSDGVTISQDGNLWIIGEGLTGIKIVDVTDKQNIVVKSTYNFKNGDADDIVITSDNQYAIVAHGITGISVLNINNHDNPYLVSEWKLDLDIGQAENVLMNMEETFIIGTLRFYGFIILGFDPKQPVMEIINLYWCGNAEMSVLSFDEKHLYTTDGNVGLRIFNIENLNNIIQVNTVDISGFPGKLRLIKYEDKYDYLFLAQQDQNILQCVNVTDIYNPGIVVKFDVLEEQAFDVECTISKEYCYMITNKGIRSLSMKNSIDIHKQIREVIEGRVGQVVQGDSLRIGQHVKVLLFPLRPGGLIQINKIQHYKNFLLSDIPQYMNFDRASLTLDVIISKLGLDQGQLFQNNIILVELVKQIKENSFINEDLQINQEISYQIRQDCQSYGYLTEQYFINEQFNPSEDLFRQEPEYENAQLQSNQFYTQETKNYIQKVLINSIIKVPVVLKFVQSLYFNPMSEDFQQVIVTESESLSIEFTIISKDLAKFVIVPLTGALVDDYVFSMQGQKDLYSLNDGINHSMTGQLNISEQKFLKFHPGIQINQEVDLQLQKQFDDSFPDGIYVNTLFTFQFSQLSFVTQQDLQITYKFEISIKNQNFYQNPTSIDWIQINYQERKIIATPPFNMFQEKFFIKIIANDNYSTVEYIIEVKVTSLPLSLILSIILGITSPLLTLFGMIQYKGAIYGIFCKKKYRDGTIYIDNGEKFRMQLIMACDTIKLALPIYKELKYSLEKQKIPITEFIDKKYYHIDTNKFSRFIISVIDKNLKFQQKSYENVEFKTELLQQNKDDLIYQIYQCSLFHDILRMKKNKKSFNTYNQFKKQLVRLSRNQNCWFQYLISIEYKDVSNSQQVLPKFLFNMVKLDEFLNMQQIFKLQNQMEKELKLIQKRFFNEEIQQSNTYSNVTQNQNIQNLQYKKIILEFDNPYFQEIIDKYQQYLKEDIDLKLILRCILNDNIGLKHTQFLKYSNGQSLNCNLADMFTIVAMNKSKRWYMRFFPNLSYLLNIDYQEIPMFKNSPLPEWLEYMYHHNIIELQGIWTSKDYENSELKIRFLNINQVPVKEFMLIRIHEKNEKINYGEKNRHSLKDIINLKHLQTFLGQSEANKFIQKQKNQQQKPKSNFGNPEIFSQSQINSSVYLNKQENLLSPNESHQNIIIADQQENQDKNKEVLFEDEQYEENVIIQDQQTSNRETHGINTRKTKMNPNNIQEKYIQSNTNLISDIINKNNI